MARLRFEIATPCHSPIHRAEIAGEGPPDSERVRGRPRCVLGGSGACSGSGGHLTPSVEQDPGVTGFVASGVKTLGLVLAVRHTACGEGMKPPLCA